MKKTIALVLVLLLMAACLVSCAQKAEEAPAAEPAAEAEAASAVEAIKAKGEFVMLTNAGFAPMEYLGADGEVAGVDVDIAQAIADELGVKLTVVDMDFDAIPAAVQAGKGDIGLAGLSILPEREEFVDFSVNYIKSALYIIVAKDSDIASSEDLAGKSIGVQMGTTSDIFASKVEGAEIARYKTAPDAVAELANGKLDAVVNDELPAKDAVANTPELKLIDEPLTTELYAAAVAKGSDLMPVVNAVLEKMLEDGSLDEIVAKRTAEAIELGQL